MPRRSEKENPDLRMLNTSIQNLLQFSVEEDLSSLTGKLEKLEEKSSELSSEKEKIRRRINPDSESQFKKLEKGVKWIEKNKEVLKTDRTRIATSICGLNFKKYAAVEKCFRVVNRNLLQIFSALVPEASAKMELKNYPPKDLDYGLDLEEITEGRECV